MTCNPYRKEKRKMKSKTKRIGPNATNAKKVHSKRRSLNRLKKSHNKRTTNQNSKKSRSPRRLLSRGSRGVLQGGERVFGPWQEYQPYMTPVFVGDEVRNGPIRTLGGDSFAAIEGEVVEILNQTEDDIWLKISWYGNPDYDRPDLSWPFHGHRPYPGIDIRGTNIYMWPTRVSEFTHIRHLIREDEIVNIFKTVLSRQGGGAPENKLKEPIINNELIIQNENNALLAGGGGNRSKKALKGGFNENEIITSGNTGTIGACIDCCNEGECPIADIHGNISIVTKVFENTMSGWEAYEKELLVTPILTRIDPNQDRFVYAKKVCEKCRDIDIRTLPPRTIKILQQMNRKAAGVSLSSFPMYNMLALQAYDDPDNLVSPLCKISEEKKDFLRESVSILHKNGICHMDLHKFNVMRGSDGNPRIIDFGEAFIFDVAKELRTEEIQGNINRNIDYDIYMLTKALKVEPPQVRLSRVSRGASLRAAAAAAADEEEGVEDGEHAIQPPTGQAGMGLFSAFPDYLFSSTGAGSGGGGGGGGGGEAASDEFPFLLRSSRTVISPRKLMPPVFSSEALEGEAIQRGEQAESSASAETGNESGAQAGAGASGAGASGAQAVASGAGASGATKRKRSII